MPFFSHAVAGAAIAWTFSPCRYRRALTVLGAVVAVVPDADVVGLQLGVEYTGLFGHRGLTHSLVFAAVAAVAAVAMWSWWTRVPLERLRRVAGCIFAAAVSHGILDALTEGGLGVAFLAPFADTRYFFPVTPIRVIPVDPAVILSRYGLGVFLNEIVCIWLPAALVVTAGSILRRIGGCTGLAGCTCGITGLDLAAVPRSAATDS